MANTNTPKDEAALKLEQLSIQVAHARLDLSKKRREERQAAESARLDLQIKRTNAEKVALDLEAARRKDAQERAADSENAEYTFCEGVTWDTAKAAIAELKKLSRRYPGKPITVTLNSPGGSVIAGLAVYDELRELSASGHHITVKVRGMAASMGGILLQAGDTRIVGAEAEVLIHEVASGTQGKVSEMQDDVNFSRHLWDKCAKILARRSTMTPEQIQDKAHKFDWWLSAEEAVARGFADKIG